jgi:hypothetical protein
VITYNAAAATIASDNRQPEYTELTAACGHTVRIRLERDAFTAADMIATFMARCCGRSTCAATVPPTSLRQITWADVNR